jgi:molecular chaperone GrpE
MNQDNSKKENTSSPEDIGEIKPETETKSEEPQVTLEFLQAEVDRFKDQWMRAIAEGENVRKRAQKEKEDAVKFAASNFARDMLSVCDNLRRALESCTHQSDFPDSVKALIAGVEMTEKELLAIFERQGIKKITPLHEKFNPNFHQAMFEIENGEVESGTILQVLQSGYILHDRLLRPALVAVAKTPPEQLSKSEADA